MAKIRFFSKPSLRLKVRFRIQNLGGKSESKPWKGWELEGEEMS